MDSVDDEYAINQNERREAERAIRENEEEMLRRRRQPLARDKLAHMTEEEMGRYFEERHAQESYAAANARSQDSDVYDDISQNSLLPTTRDPTLWMIKVRQGEERATALFLIRKCIASANNGDALGIYTIICKDNLKGLLYVEARKHGNVSKLVSGVSAINQFDIKVRFFCSEICNLLHKSPLQMVPINEMSDTLKIVKSVPQLNRDDYVRLKRTMYKGDLAQVDWFDIAQNQVHLRLLPRIDLKKKRNALRAVCFLMFFCFVFIFTQIT